MKNHAGLLLIVITIAFSAFVLGFVLGRSSGRSGVQVSVSQASVTTPALSAASPAPTIADGPSQTPETTLWEIHYPLDINSATKEEFESLPGVGNTLAQRILDYRRANGRFASTEQLMNIEGIGESLYWKIKDYLTVLR